MLRISGCPAWRVVQADWSQHHQGQPHGGAQDQFAAQRVLGLAGRALDEPVIEWDMGQLKLQAEEQVYVVVGGAPGEVKLNDQLVSRYMPLCLSAGDILTAGPANSGVHGYVAIAGEITAAGQDGLEVSPADEKSIKVDTHRSQAWGQAGAWAPKQGVLRCLPGPEWDESMRPLLAGPWRVTPKRSRSGMVLTGPAIPDGISDIISGPVVDGCVQLTPSGLILMTRDRPTVGGYSRVWVVIDADIDIAVQMRSDMSIRFEMVSMKQADAISEHRLSCLHASIGK